MRPHWYHAPQKSEIEAAAAPPGPTLAALSESFLRSCQARGLSQRTFEIYELTLRQLRGFLEERGMPTAPGAISREHIETYITYRIETTSPATAALALTFSRTFFRWLVEEGEITDDPTAKIRKIKVIEKPVVVLSKDELVRLFNACRGTRWQDRRDAAILRVFLDTGIRVGEMVKVLQSDIVWDNPPYFHVRRGKGGKPRQVPLGYGATAALDRYIRVRPEPRPPDDDHLWLTRVREAFNVRGMHMLVARLGQRVQIDGLHPHIFRHTFAHMWLLNGGNETDLMRIGGWKNFDQLQRYGASASDERARAAHRERSPVDKLGV